ncbi:hypothetical protein L9F63_015109, partial [Diploptera punctata]
FETESRLSSAKYPTTSINRFLLVTSTKTILRKCFDLGVVHRPIEAMSSYSRDFLLRPMPNV